MKMTSSLIVLCLVGVLSSANAWFMFSSSGRQQAEGVISEECMRKAERGECLFYVCFDQRHPCERDNYALSYGWRFCDKIEKNYHRFNRQGKEWINGTRTCSMMKMLEFYRASHINCGDVQAEMQRNHAECEVEQGACDGGLLMDNKDVLTDVFTFDRKVLVRFLSMLRECSVTSAGDFLSFISAQGKTVMAFFRSIPERLSGLQEDITALRESLPELSLPDINPADFTVTVTVPKLVIMMLPETDD